MSLVPYVGARIPHTGDQCPPLFQDTFTGADGVALTSHTPDIAPVGFTWQVDSALFLLDGTGRTYAPAAPGGEMQDSSFTGMALTTKRLSMSATFRMKGSNYDFDFATDVSAIQSLSNSNTRVAWAPLATNRVAGILTGIPLTGKKYCEFALVQFPVGGARYVGFGVGLLTASGPASPVSNSSANILRGSGTCGFGTVGFNNSGVYVANAGAAIVEGDRIGVAFDTTTRKMWVSINGVYVTGDPVAGTGEAATAPTPGAGTLRFYAGFNSCTDASGTYTADIFAKASQQTYAPPTGFTAYNPN